MLYANGGTGPRTTIEAGPHAGAGLEDVVWFDLLNPTDAERSLAERLTGLRVPALADLSEIESSSRLSAERGVLYLSAPTHLQDAQGVSHASPLGFVLSETRLLTVRYCHSPVFDQFAASLARRQQEGAGGSGDLFLGLLEAIIDRLADVLEHIGADLDAISRRVFRPEAAGSTPARTDMQLRATLRSVGRAGERLSNLRDSLLGVQRVVLYTAEAASWMPAAQRPRFVTLKQDIGSLTEYDVQLSDKVQFLLDATLGFINIEQNNGIKVLTVVSVVGVPPTLLASIYGMNFKSMPELQWEHGYAYGLAVILASGVLPLLWFKRKGWI